MRIRARGWLESLAGTGTDFKAKQGGARAPGPMAQIVGLAQCALTALLFLAWDPRRRRWGPGPSAAGPRGQGRVPLCPGHVARPGDGEVRRQKKARGRGTALPSSEVETCPTAAGQAAQPVGSPLSGVRGRAPEAEGRPEAEGSPLGLEDWPTLPIYQTTGVHAEEGSGGAATRAPGAESRAGSALDASAGLHGPPASSASPLSVGAPARPREAEDPLQLLRSPSWSRGPARRGPPSSQAAARRDPLLSPTLRGALSGVLGGRCGLSGPRQRPLVFQNRQFAHLMGDPLGATRSAGRSQASTSGSKTKVDFDDFLPAIRKPGTPTSAARAKDGRTVHSIRASALRRKRPTGALSQGSAPS